VGIPPATLVSRPYPGSICDWSPDEVGDLGNEQRIAADLERLDLVARRARAAGVTYGVGTLLGTAVR
jgi:hypothetical protein